MNATIAPTIKAGTVLVDGISVGTVAKVDHDGLWSDGHGIRVNGFEWVATTLAGEIFDGFKTRKAAAARLARHAEPLTVSDVRIGDYMGDRFIQASVTWQGHHAEVSRYPHETGWVVDAFFRPGTFFPVWSNGAGSRYTRAHVLQGEHATAADAALIESGVTL